MATVQQGEAANPANPRSAKVTDQTRISAATPVRQLEVAAITGYRLYWIADRPGRIDWALRVGYEFVTPEEAQTNSRSLGSDTTLDGNNDLGSRVSIHGGTDERGSSQRLYLMKIKQDWFEKDRQAQAAVSEAIVATLKRGMVGADKDVPGDASKRYVRGVENIFTKKQRA